MSPPPSSLKSILPHFAPRRSHQLSRQFNPSITITEPFLSSVQLILSNRPRLFKHQTKPHLKPWHRRPSHRIPTLWSLYRDLLNHTKALDHILESSSTPHSSHILLNEIRQKFKQGSRLRSVSDIQEALRQAYLLLHKLVLAQEDHTSPAFQEISERRRSIIDLAHRQSWSKVYHAQLEARARRARRPIMTGRFLRPTILNGPLPRLANQPLHISMMIACRRKARERRLIEERVLREQIQMVELEDQFDARLVPEGFERGNSREDLKFHRDRLRQISQSFALERSRERQVYSREMLDEIEAARRRRPLVLRARNLRARFQRRMDEMVRATSDDSEAPEIPEGHSFRPPGMEFWAGGSLNEKGSA